MKQMFARTLILLTLVVMGLAMAAPAQSTPILKANIPFEFSFGGRTFPAGSYSVVRPLQHALELRDSEGHPVARVFTSGIVSLAPVTDTKLRFEYSGGRHVLTEVWQQEESSGERLYPVKERVNFAKDRPADVRETTGGSQP